MADEIAALQSGRNLKDVVRYAVGVGLGIVVLVLLFGRRGEVLAAKNELGHVAPWWLVPAVAAEALSLGLYAYLQHRVLRLAGSNIAMRGLFLLTMANDAIANTVPAGPAVAGAYRYRYYRRHGASAASAGWTIFTILLTQAIAMSLVLLLGVLVALGGSRGGTTRAAVAGIAVVVAAGAVLARRDLVLRIGEAAVRMARRVTGHPRGRVVPRISATMAQMRDIPLGPASSAAVIALAASVWLGDLLCLLCVFGAVRAAVPWSGVLIAYGVAEVASALPIVPGGIGVVEGSLAVVLAAYGAPRAAALSAALVFRAVSFWLAMLAGWMAVAVIASQARRQPAGDSVVR